MVRRLTSLGGLTLAVLAGCAAPPAPPPAPASIPVAVAAPPAAPVLVGNGSVAPVMIIVAEPPPPAPQREFVTARPTADHIWVAGFWCWYNDRYEWQAGRWELPPTPSATWVPPRWEREGEGYRFFAGYWN